MMTGRWNLRLDRFRSRIGENVKKKAERVTQELVDRFIESSPVYQGRFRAAWNVSEGRPVFVSIPRDAGSPDNPLPAPRIVVRATSDFPIFYITNGQPYGVKLEYGSSDQAPHGVVRVNIASMR